VQATIKPALDAGQWVVCDRFTDSTRVYQGVLGHVDPQLIRALERLTTADTRPDLTFILDLAPEIGLARAAKRRGRDRADRFEDEALEFHTRLRAGFRDIAAAEPQRCVLIDADRPADAIADEIWSVVNTRLDPAQTPMSLEYIEL